MLSSFEVYSNSGEVDNYDHYIPKLLLRRWRVTESGVDKGSVYTWKKLTTTIKKDSINQVGGEHGWDTTISNGLPSDFISKKLFSELIEEKASGVIKMLNRDSEERLTIPEESTLTVFIANQITRVPAFRSALLHYISLGLTKGLIAESDLGNKGALLEKVVSNSIGISYEDFFTEKSKLKVKGGKNLQIILALQIANKMAAEIYQGHLHVIEIPTGSNEEFVISDNPVVVLDFERGILLPFFPWWEANKRHLWIFMPISPNKAIFYSKSKKRDGRVEKDNMDLVTLFNYGQYAYSKEIVFARSEAILKRHLTMYRTELLHEGKTAQQYLRGES